ncbi:MAG: hypothetical protein ACI37Z_03620 [Candidatus Gastranaerophilaceae bacterium]
MGIGRAGKTTLSEMLKEKYNNYSLIHSDSLKWAIIRVQNQEEYYRKNVNKQKEFEHGEYFQKILLEFFNSCVRNDKNHHGYILESGQLSPELVHKMVDFNETIVVCLGLGDLNADEIVDLCLKHDAEKDWTFCLPKEYIKNTLLIGIVRMKY